MPRVVEQFTRGPRRPQPWRQEEFDARVRETLAGQHFAKTLGIEPVSIAYGCVSLRLPVRPLVFQQYSYVHGGAIGALMDTATGMCSVTMVGPDEMALTSELKINFLSPGEGDFLIATARVIKDGKRLIIMEAEATAVFPDGQTRDVAHMTTSYIRFPKPTGD